MAANGSVRQHEVSEQPRIVITSIEPSSIEHERVPIETRYSYSNRPPAPLPTRYVLDEDEPIYQGGRFPEYVTPTYTYASVKRTPSYGARSDAPSVPTSIFREDISYKPTGPVYYRKQLENYDGRSIQGSMRSERSYRSTKSKRSEVREGQGCHCKITKCEIALFVLTLALIAGIIALCVFAFGNKWSTYEADDLKDSLNLQKHSTFNGHYRSTWFAGYSVHSELHNGTRAGGSAMFFLLSGTEFVPWHRMKSDEVWLYHRGGILKFHILQGNSYRTELLGDPLSNTESQFSVLIPSGSWFAVELHDTTSYALSTVVDAPGLSTEYKDLDEEIAEEIELQKLFPNNNGLVSRLTIKK